MALLHKLAQARDVRSPAALARMLGVSQQRLKNWEARGISKEGALKAQAVLGFDCNKLLALDVDDNATPAPTKPRRPLLAPCQPARTWRRNPCTTPPRRRGPGLLKPSPTRSGASSPPRSSKPSNRSCWPCSPTTATPARLQSSSSPHQVAQQLDLFSARIFCFNTYKKNSRARS